MNPAYDQALDQCRQLWQDQKYLAAMIGHWRGLNSLDRFDPLQRGCVVLVEYARHALSSQGSDEDLRKLDDACNAILKVEFPSNHNWRALYPCVVAITKTVLTASQFSDARASTNYLTDAARFYDRIWNLKSPPVEPIGDPSKAVDEASKRLHAMVKSADENSQTISVSTWLILHRLLSRIFGAPEAIPAWENELKMLVVDERRFRGKVIDVRFERIPAPQSAIYPDPLSLGAISLGEAMRQSLNLA